MLRRYAGEDVRLPDRLAQRLRRHRLQLQPGQHATRRNAYFMRDGQRRGRMISRHHYHAYPGVLRAPDRVRNFRPRRIPHQGEAEKLAVLMTVAFAMSERQHATTISGVSVGLLSPVPALFDGKTAALQYHFRRALDIAHERAAFFHGRAHEFVRAVERQRTATRT